MAGAILAISMTVNALVMGLIVFRLFEVFREVRAASNERILGTTGGDTLRAIIFVLIESGTALFSIQFVRLVIILVSIFYRNKGSYEGYSLVSRIHKMFNVIIQLRHFYFHFILLIMRTLLGYNTHIHPCAGIDGIIFSRRGFWS